MSNTSYTTNDFLQWCETNNPELGKVIVDNFINNMIESNPNRKEMTKSDWMRVMMNDYHVLVDDGGVLVTPNDGNHDYDIIECL